MMNRAHAFLCSLLLAAAYLLFCVLSAHGFYPREGYSIRTKPVRDGLLTAGRDQAENSRQLRALLPGETININTSDAESLQRLPGIGPVLAEEIIAYRENEGLFLRPEDLMNVPGIGEKTYSLVRDSIRVGGKS